MHISGHISKVQRKVSYSILGWDQINKLVLVWAAAEKRNAIMKMEEANAIKLALLLAKEKGRSNVIIQGTNKGLMKKLKEQDADDSQCATTLENIAYLRSLFNAIRVAKFVLGLKNVIRWKTDFPSWIKEIPQVAGGQLPLL